MIIISLSLLVASCCILLGHEGNSTLEPSIVVCGNLIALEIIPVIGVLVVDIRPAHKGTVQSLEE